MACVTPTIPSSSTPVLPSTFTTVTPVSITTAQCVYSDWTNWTSCTVTCGQGTQTHARNIIAGFCTDPLTEVRMCQMEPCPCIFTQDIYISTFQKLPPADSEYIKMRKQYCRYRKSIFQILLVGLKKIVSKVIPMQLKQFILVIIWIIIP
jgi:hypothetical protein